MHTLVICCSLKPSPSTPHKLSACRQLATLASQGAQHLEASVSFLDLRTLDLPLFDGRCAKDYQSQDLHATLVAIKRAKSIVIGVPAYWRGLSGVTKNFFDVLAGASYDGVVSTPLRDKEVYALVVGAADGDSLAAYEQFRLTITSMGARVSSHCLLVDNPRESPDAESIAQQAFALGCIASGRHLELGGVS